MRIERTADRDMATGATGATGRSAWPAAVGLAGAGLVAAGWVALGLSLAATPVRAATGDVFLEEVNRLRAAGGITCPAVDYLNGPPDPPMLMAAAPPLRRSAVLDSAAQAYARAVADKTSYPQDEPRFLGPAGYLAWHAASDMQTGSGALDEVAAARARATADSFWGSGCRAAFGPGYGEIGIATAVAGGFTTFLFIVADPFDPARVPEYARRFFDEINGIRARGVTCPGGAQFGPMPPLVWSDGLAAAAQGHSEDMATWPFRGGDPHAGSNGSTAQTRVAAVPCTSTGVWENVAANATKTPGDAWAGLSAGHCAALMANQKHAGIGVSHAPALAGTLWGRSPFVTLDIATVTGACRPADPVTPVEPPRYGVFEPTRFYRVSNLGLADARPLDIYPGSETRSRRDEPTTVLPFGNYTGQQWRLVAVPNSSHVVMSTAFRGESEVLTINSIHPPLLLYPLYDQRIATGIPKAFQYWLFEAVAGAANTYRIVNSAYGGHPIYLKAEATGTVGYAANPDPGDRSTHWKVEPFN